MNTSQISTGDVILFRGGSNIASEVIEAFTGPYCHVGMFFLKDGQPWIAEMYNDYREISLDDRLAEGGTSTPCWGMAPAIIREQTQAVNAAMDAFRSDAADHKYNYGALVEVWASDKLGAHYDANETRPVCSVFVQRIWAAVLQGDFTSLYSPSDIANLCQSVTPIT